MEVNSAYKKYEIVLVKTSDIEPHEEEIYSHTLKLAREIKDSGILFRPIIIEKEYNMVVDGTHRLSSLKLLNLKFIPALVISYMDKVIKIDRWVRVFSGLEAYRIKEFFGKFDELTLDEYNPYRKKGIYISHKGRFWYKRITNDMEISMMIHEIENKFGYLIKSYKPGDSLRQIERENLIYLDYTPPSKESVLKMFRLNIKFPPKYTRHIHPYADVRVDIPIKYLNDEKKAYKYLYKAKFIS